MKKLLRNIVIILVLGFVILLILEKILGWPLFFIREKIELNPTPLVLKEITDIEELITAEYSGEVLSNFYDTRKTHFKAALKHINDNQPLFLKKSNQIMKKYSDAMQGAAQHLDNSDKEIIKYFQKCKAIESRNEDLIAEIQSRIYKIDEKKGIEYLNLISDNNNTVYNFHIVKDAYEEKIKKIKEKKYHALNSHEFLELISKTSDINVFIEDINVDLRKIVKDKEKKIVENINFAYIVRGRVVASFDLNSVTEKQCFYDAFDESFYILAFPKLEPIANPYFAINKDAEMPGFIPIGTISVNDHSYDTIRSMKQYAKELLLQDAITQGIEKIAKESAESILTRFLSFIPKLHIKKVKIIQNPDLFNKMKKYIDASVKAAENASSKRGKKYLKQIVKAFNIKRNAFVASCQENVKNLPRFGFDLLTSVSASGKPGVIIFSPINDVPDCIKEEIEKQLQKKDFGKPPEDSYQIRIAVDINIQNDGA